MKAALLIVAALALPVQADVVAQATAPNGRQVILHNTLCKGETHQYVVQLLAPDRTHMFDGCWYPSGGLVRIKWSDGDESAIPLQVFFGKSGPQS